MTRPELVAVLEKIFIQLDPHLRSRLCLVGTSSALLQGIELPVNDIDLLAKNRETVNDFIAALSEYSVLSAPSLLDGGVQYFASITVSGIRVEVSTVEIPTKSTFKEVTGRGPWLHQNRQTIGETSIQAVALELRIATELLRNRVDRLMPLVRHFAQTSETALLLEVLRAEGLESVFEELKGRA